MAWKVSKFSFWVNYSFKTHTKQHFFHVRTFSCFSSHMANIWVTPSIPFSSFSTFSPLFFRSGSKWTSSHSLSVSLFPQQVAYQTVCAPWPALCKPKPPITAFLLHLCESVILFSILPVVPMMTPSTEVWWPLQTWTLLQFPMRGFSPFSLSLSLKIFELIFDLKYWILFLFQINTVLFFDEVSIHQWILKKTCITDPTKILILIILHNSAVSLYF